MMINTYISLNKKTILGSFAFPAAVFLITEMAYVVALGIFKQNSTFMFLSAGLPIATAAYIMILLIYHCFMLYEQSIKMGRTRRETVPALLGYGLLFSLTLMAFAEMLVLVDILITYKLWLAIYPELFIFGDRLIIPIWGVALMAVAAPMLGFSFAAASHRWGKHVMLVFWICWMLTVLFPTVGTPIINFVEANYIILPIAGIVLFIWALRYYSRAAVK